MIEVFIITNRKGSDKIDISFDEATDQHNTTAMYEEKALYRLQLSGRYKYFNYVLFVLRHNSKIRNNHVCY